VRASLGGGVNFGYTYPLTATLWRSLGRKAQSDERTLAYLFASTYLVYRIMILTSSRGRGCAWSNRSGGVGIIRESKETCPVESVSSGGVGMVCGK
jgi:hypothetical protein